MSLFRNRFPFLLSLRPSYPAGPAFLGSPSGPTGPRSRGYSRTYRVIALPIMASILISRYSPYPSTIALILRRRILSLADVQDVDLGFNVLGFLESLLDEGPTGESRAPVEGRNRGRIQAVTSLNNRIETLTEARSTAQSLGQVYRRMSDRGSTERDLAL